MTTLCWLLPTLDLTCFFHFTIKYYYTFWKFGADNNFANKRFYQHTSDIEFITIVTSFFYASLQSIFRKLWQERLSHVPSIKSDNFMLRNTVPGLNRQANSSTWMFYLWINQVSLEMFCIKGKFHTFLLTKKLDVS